MPLPPRARGEPRPRENRTLRQQEEDRCITKEINHFERRIMEKEWRILKKNCNIVFAKLPSADN